MLKVYIILSVYAENPIKHVHKIFTNSLIVIATLAITVITVFRCELVM